MRKTNGPQWVAIESIWIDERLQARESISDEVVAEYSEIIDDSKDDWPFDQPVQLADFDGELYCVDGFHRITSVSRAQSGNKVFAAITKVATWQDCVRLALCANSKHGLRRTAADKRKAVAIALREFPQSSIKEVASICEVSVGLVAKLANQVATPQFKERKEKFGDTQKKNKPALDIVEDVKTRKPCTCGANAWSLTDGGYKCCVCFSLEGGKPIKELSKDKKAARAAYGKLVRELDAIELLDKCRLALNSIALVIN